MLECTATLPDANATCSFAHGSSSYCVHRRCLGFNASPVCRYLAAQCPEASPDGREITATRWLHWQWLGQRQGWLQRPQLHPQPQAAAFSFPGRSSLANRMLTRWIAECEGEWAGAAVPDCDIDEGTCVDLPAIVPVLCACKPVVHSNFFLPLRRMSLDSRNGHALDLLARTLLHSWVARYAHRRLCTLHL